MTFDAVIVGGGIVGTACALAFSRAGMRVALVERELQVPLLGAFAG